METKLILGGPGTGKTSRLMEIVEREIESGVRPERIAFVSFTRAAVEEARRRACVRFRLFRKNFPFFQTVHAMCYGQTGVRRGTVLDHNHYKEIGRTLGIRIEGRSLEGDEDFGGIPEGDRMIFLEGLSRCTRRPLKDVWADSYSDVSLPHLEMFAAYLSKFKKERGLVDFTDMLESFVRDAGPLPVEVAIVDEAQDLSPLQWEVVDLAFSKTKRLYFAGDDDQAIYQWSGADVDRFVEMRVDDVEILRHSHRLPESVHRVSRSILDKVSHRRDKPFLSTGKSGVVETVPYIDALDFGSGDWRILVRNSCFLPPILKRLRSAGIAFSTYGRPSVPAEWEGKTEIPDDAPDWLLPYYRAVIDRYGKLTSRGTVSVGTIHSSKGSESGNVVLITDLTASTAASMSRDEDSEHRVFYVGATRALDRLVLTWISSSWSYAGIDTGVPEKSHLTPK